MDAISGDSRCGGCSWYWSCRQEETPEQGITNCYQLFGKFLLLRGPDEEGHEVDDMEHTEKFWQWLKTTGISSHRSAIVRAIAEKSATFFTGIYDANEYADDDE